MEVVVTNMCFSLTYSFLCGSWGICTHPITLLSNITYADVSTVILIISSTVNELVKLRDE